jgi:hypothetical protein
MIWYKSNELSVDGDCVPINTCDTCNAINISCFNFDSTSRIYEEKVYTQKEINGICNFYDENDIPIGDTCGVKVNLQCMDTFTCNRETYEPTITIDGNRCEYKSSTTSKVKQNDTCVFDDTTRCSTDEFYSAQNGMCSKCGDTYTLVNNNAVTFDKACTIVDSCRSDSITCFEPDCKMSMKKKKIDASTNECVPPDGCETACTKPPPARPVRCRRDPRRRCIHPEDFTAEFYAHNKEDNCRLKSKESDKTIDACKTRCPATMRIATVDEKLKCV